MTQRGGRFRSPCFLCPVIICGYHLRLSSAAVICGVICESLLRALFRAVAYFSAHRLCVLALPRTLPAFGCLQHARTTLFSSMLPVISRNKKTGRPADRPAAEMRLRHHCLSEIDLFFISFSGVSCHRFFSFLPLPGHFSRPSRLSVSTCICATASEGISDMSDVSNFR